MKLISIEIENDRLQAVAVQEVWIVAEGKKVPETLRIASRAVQDVL